MDITSLPYRPCVGMMVVSKDRKVFVGQRLDTRAEAWQMPQGGIDEGEEPAQAVMRELQEEVGTDAAEIVASSQGWFDYDLPEHLVPQLWGGKYRGQRQKWFLLRFTGVDADIRIDTAHQEFAAWQWASLADVPRLIVPFKRKLYEQVIAEFMPQIETHW